MPALQTRADALQVFKIGGPGARSTLQTIETIPGILLQFPLAFATGASDRNGPGKGAIRSDGDGKTLSWRAPGSTAFGIGERVLSDSDVLLEDGEDRGKYIIARVKPAFLRPEPTEHPVYVQERWTAQFRSFTAAEAAGGLILTELWFAENQSNQVLSNCRIWVATSSPYISISVDGVSYTKPTTEGGGLLLKTAGAPDGCLLPNNGNTAEFNVRRTIPAGTKADPRVLALLHFTFDGV